ncbi:MAG: CCA tRNA nucleotidyltransferase, partial [Armatimonadota bacterium]|nr:CCA tRNA nucleotidyltransferase [Armatimonadota bacterium]
ELRHVRPCLSGDELVAMGVPRGPAVGALLRELLDRRLNGELETREEELEIVRDRLARGVRA